MLLHDIRTSITQLLRQVDDLILLVEMHRIGQETGRSSAASTEPDGIIKTPSAPGSSEGIRFVVTSLFLRECHEHLTQQPEETVAYLSGLMVGNSVVLDCLVPVRNEIQEMGYAKADINAATDVLLSLSDRGFGLRGTIHSHPGIGIESTTPSTKDRTLHNGLEKGGYQAIGIIMTRDGHCRFFSHKMPFVVEVVGKDVVRLGYNEYRLLLEYHPEE